MRNLISIFLLFAVSLCSLPAQETVKTEVCQVVTLSGLSGWGETADFYITAHGTAFVIEFPQIPDIEGIIGIFFLGPDKSSHREIVCGFTRPYFESYVSVDHGWFIDIPNEYIDCFTDAPVRGVPTTLEVCFIRSVPVVELRN